MANKALVDRLAKAWLAEAERLRSINVCACGECDSEQIRPGSRFKPGHDAKLLSRYKRDIARILGD